MKSILLNDIIHKPLLLSISINALFFALFFFSITPSFDTSDDTVIMMISSGFLTGQPSEYIIHMSVILGIILKFLYTHIPVINWYIVLLFSAHFIAMTALFYVFLKLGKNLYSILLFLVLTVFFELFLLTHVQYTSTGFVVGTSGLVLFLSTMTESGKFRKISIVVTAALMTLAMLIRFEVIYGVAVMAVPVLLLRYIETRSSYAPVFVVLVLAISWGVVTYEKDYYAKHGYPNIRKYQRGVQILTGEPIRVTDELLKKVNWSRNDLTLLQEWFWLDQEIYSDWKIATLSSSARSVNDASGITKQLSTGIVYRKKEYLVLGLFCLFSLCLLMAWFSVAKNRTRYEALVVATMLLACFCLTYAAKAPLRVILSLAFIVCAVSFYFSLEFLDKGRAINALKIHFLLILMICASFQFNKIARDSKANEKHHMEYFEAMREVRSCKDSLFVIVGGDFPYTSMPLFRNPKMNSTFNILITGWVAHTPAHYSVLSAFSIGNIMKSFYEKKNVYLIGGGKSFADSLIKFYREHYDKEVRIDFDVPVKEKFMYLKPMRVICAQGKSDL